MTHRARILGVGVICTLLLGGLAIVWAAQGEQKAEAPAGLTSEAEAECNSCSAKHKIRRLKPKPSDE